MMKMVVILVCGSIPFCALGLAIGYFAKPNSAPAMVNLIYLPLSFLVGLWIPVQMLPKTLAAHRNISAALSPEPVGIGRDRRWPRRIAMVACSSADWRDAVVHGAGAHRISARPGKAVRMSFR